VNRSLCFFIGHGCLHGHAKFKRRWLSEIVYRTRSLRHAEDTLPFGIAHGTRLRPVIHSRSFIGTEVPVWDIADNFGDTNLL
jgi:hypothetical protein